jgi:hypothetical protein
MKHFVVQNLKQLNSEFCHKFVAEINDNGGAGRPICGSALQHLAISWGNDLSFGLTRNHQRRSERMPPFSHHIHHTAPGNGNLTMDILAASENIFIDLHP